MMRFLLAFVLEVHIYLATWREGGREREWAEKASPKPTNKKQNYG